MNLPPGISPLPNTANLVVLSDSHDLLIKRYYPLVIRLDFPKGLQPGQSVSNFQLLMQIKKNLEAHQLFIYSGRVLESTVEHVKFHALMESQDAIDKATRRLLKQKIKAPTFKTPLSVNVEKVRMLSQSERDWDSYFEKADGMDPKVPGKRPDTLYLSKLPVNWFHHGRDGLPDEEVFRKIFSKFGEVRTVDVPRADRFRSKMSADVSGIRTGALVDHQDITFEAYVQFVDYAGFSTAMKFFGGYAKLVWRGTNGNGTGYLQADIIVDFNRDCHLCPEKIKRRSELRKALREKEHEELKELKKKEDEERRKREEEEFASRKKAEELAAAEKKKREDAEAEEAKNKPKHDENENHYNNKHRDDKDSPLKSSNHKERHGRKHSDSKRRSSTDEKPKKVASDRRRRSSPSPDSKYRSRRPSSSSQHNGDKRDRSRSERKSSRSNERTSSRASDEKRRKLSDDDRQRRQKDGHSHRKHTKSLSERSRRDDDHGRAREVSRGERRNTEKSDERKEVTEGDRRERELREFLLMEREKQLRAKLLKSEPADESESEHKEEMEVEDTDAKEEDLREYLLKKQEEALRKKALQTIHSAHSESSAVEDEPMQEDGEASDGEESELRRILLQERERALRAKLTQMVSKSIS